LIEDDRFIFSGLLNFWAFRQVFGRLPPENVAMQWN
jgi:hypothetical protein